MDTRKAIVAILFAIIMIVIVELSAYALIYASRPYFSEPIRKTTDIYLEQSDQIRRWLRMGGRARDVVDPDLGWRYRPGHSNAANQINSQGLRSRREFAPMPPDGVLRVAAFGDSFVYGNEVENDDAWATVVDTAFERIELLNYGVGGYGVDQAMLRFRREGSDLTPHVVLIGFIADDIRRVVNVYQRFASTNSGIFTKPRFLLDTNGHLSLLPSPIRRLDDWRAVLEEPELIREWGEHDQWYEPLVYENALYDISATVRLLSTVWVRLYNRYFDPDRLFLGDTFNTAAEAYELQMKIFEEFVSDVRESGARPIVLILPSRGELRAEMDSQETAYRPLLEDLSEMGIEYWDATEAFLSAPRPPDLRPWFAPGGHYSPAGNRIVAMWLGEALLELADDMASVPH